MWQWTWYDTKTLNDNKKNRYIGLRQDLKMLCIKGHYRESEETIYKMGENI